MKILGICGSPRAYGVSGVYKLVGTVLEASGCDHELISLRGKNISGCTACLGCIGDNVCKLEDDMEPMRQKIADADAYVVGAANYYSGINALAHALLERLYQFRHQHGDTLWGKLAVAVGVGGTTGWCCCEQIEMFMAYNFIETVAKVTGRGAACCYTCGYGETCKVGLPIMLYGEGVRISPEMIPDVTKQADVMADAAKAGELLGQRLSSGHDRQKVTQKMQKRMMEKFKSST